MNCNLCGSKNFKKDYWKIGNLGYTKCNKCGLIFQCPMFTQEELSEIYKNYFIFKRESQGLEYGYRNYEHERSVNNFKKHYLSWLNKYITEKDSFLDFGCGTGNLIKLMREQGHKAEGCEFSEEAIAILVKKQIPFWQYKDIDKIKKKYRYISIIDVIEHLESPSEDLKKIASLLEDNGLLFIETVNSDDFFVKYIYKNNWQGIGPPHLYLWGEKTLTKLLKKFGFKIIEIKKYKMSGSLISRIIQNLLYYPINIALIFIKKKETFLGYKTEKLKHFIGNHKKSHYQFSFGDGIRIVAQKYGNFNNHSNL